ncbi:type VI secretion system baseplate subunit TssE [Yersinia nurmii]|uniref:Type VI secretion system baseplate subunit TssE n=1 Tax=Yersinia nurmii TaxID=685706 RepID=A0AAW7K020_9GAMM|nr:type VI secretion system baseplate subunit TssE [Yersinia nurmii]MDN0088657.1 type VI secretion system baseplate subunit TssE [Yersinia nurmii]CNF22282.1 type VI secretion system lysozyme-like protein [Yersinia nurmii]
MAALLSWERGSSSSLFERIQGEGSGLSRRARADDLLVSIKGHLNKVLNARPGGCQSSIELGVIDLNDATSTATDFRRSIEQAIKTCIESYEPRISSVSVHAETNDGDPLLLNFRISAQVSFDNIGDLVEFNIQLDNNRHYRFDQDL